MDGFTQHFVQKKSNMEQGLTKHMGISIFYLWTAKRREGQIYFSEPFSVVCTIYRSSF